MPLVCRRIQRRLSLVRCRGVDVSDEPGAPPEILSDRHMGRGIADVRRHTRLTSPALKRGTFAPSLLPQIRLSHSFTDDPEQLQVVMGQLQQTQEMEEKDDLLLHQSEKEARAAAQQALDQANSLHQAAEAAEEQALKTQQRNKDLAMKAKVLEQRARMEGAKVAAVSKAVAKMAAEKEQIRASDDEQ
eukprot:s2318_g4.t2